MQYNDFWKSHQNTTSALPLRALAWPMHTPFRKFLDVVSDARMGAVAVGWSNILAQPAAALIFAKWAQVQYASIEQ